MRVFPVGPVHMIEQPFIQKAGEFGSMENLPGPTSFLESQNVFDQSMVFFFVLGKAGIGALCKESFFKCEVKARELDHTFHRRFDGGPPFP